MASDKEEVEATVISGSSLSANYCTKKKTEESKSEFLKAYMKEFIGASMDQHKACLTKTIHKVFAKLKADGPSDSASESK